MRPEHLQRLDGIFHSALELPPELRDSFLDEACANDPDLRTDIESLISAHEQSGNFIEGSAADVAALFFPDDAAHIPQVSQYTVDRLLGSGGMGEVYLATDKMGRKVALKVLAPRLIRDPQHVDRFLQEARAVLALNHPNVVTVYDIGEADGVYYIASELIEGETLRTALARGGLEPGHAIEITIQICTALAAAHEKGIVHRDVKPENVMLRGDGYVKVLDFGIAKLTEELGGLGRTGAATKSSLDTAEGLVIGTAAYMSPEQARGAHVDVRTDVWICGAVLYEILSGHVPFAGGSAAEVLAKVLEHEPAPLASLVKDPPAELQRIVTKALMKEPGDRYQTITQMLADLKGLKQDIEFSAKLQRLNSTGGGSAQAFAPVSTLPGTESAPGRIKPYRRGVLLALSVAVVAVVAVSVGLVRNPFYRSADIKSVAVLPLVNSSGDPALDYLSDGMTESLINALARLPDLSVKARSAVFRFKGKEVEPQEVASALSVQAVVGGRHGAAWRHTDTLSLVDERERWQSDLGRALRQHDGGPGRPAE